MTELFALIFELIGYGITILGRLIMKVVTLNKFPKGPILLKRDNSSNYIGIVFLLLLIVFLILWNNNII